MKILYSAGKLNGSNERLGHFLRNTNHEVKIAAYYNNSSNIERIDWVLDSLYFGDTNPKIIESYIGEPLNLNSVPFEMMLDDISEWNPELFIVDFEPILTMIAKCLDIPFLSCSPLHLIDGVYWESRNKHLFSNIGQDLKVFDGAIEKLIYSPFGMLENSPSLLPGYDWITPYPEESSREGLKSISKRISDSNKALSIGTSGSIAKYILDEQQICVADDPEDIECSLNGVFVDSLGLGMAIGKAEENMTYASVKIDKFLSTEYEYHISKCCDFLHERII